MLCFSSNFYKHVFGVLQESFVARHGDTVVIASTIMGALMAVSSMGLLTTQTIALMLVRKGHCHNPVYLTMLHLKQPCLDPATDLPSLKIRNG